MPRVLKKVRALKRQCLSLNFFLVESVLDLLHQRTQDCKGQLTRQEHLVHLGQPDPVDDVDILGPCARALETPGSAYR